MSVSRRDSKWREDETGGQAGRLMDGLLDGWELHPGLLPLRLPRAAMSS